MRKLLAWCLIALAFLVGTAEAYEPHGGTAVSPIPLVQVWKGNSNHFRITFQQDSSANWSTCSRTIHTSTADFEFSKLLIPTFWTAGSNPIIDTLLPSSFTYAASLEYPVTQNTNNVPARTLVFRTGGSATWTYTAGTGPGYILTDQLDAGQVIPAGSKYGIFYCVQNVLGSGSGSGTLFQSLPIGSYLGPTYEVVSGTQTDQIAAGWTTTRTNVGTSTVGAEAWTPVSLIILQDSRVYTQLALGDSIYYGSDDGSPPNTEGVGDVNGNAGWAEKYIVGRLGIGGGTFSKGGDKYGFHATLANIQYRMAMAPIMAPNFITSGLGHNDSSSNFATMLANAQTALSNYRHFVPTTKIIGSTVIPDSSTPVPATFWGMTSDQTPNPAWLQTGTPIYQWNNSEIRNLNSNLGMSAYIEASDPISTSRDSSIWKATTTTTTLAAAITTTSQTAITTTAAMQGCDATSAFEIMIDSEIMVVTAGQATASLTVTRGADGTTPATHLSGATTQWVRQNTFDGTHPTTCGITAIVSGITSANPYTAPLRRPANDNAGGLRVINRTRRRRALGLGAARASNL